MSEKNEENIKVIGAGLPRTGTSSLQAALQKLGYDPCHHMVSDVLGDVHGRGKRWIEAWDTKDKQTRHALMKDILKEYKAAVDFPCSLFVDDLIEIYPNAKVVLGLRKSPEAWRASFNQTLDLTYTPWWYVLAWMFPTTRYLVLDAAPRWEKLTQERHNAQVYRTSSVDIYYRHNDWVRSVVPKDRLLEFEPSQGWEPLCKFLGNPIPAEPYPHMYEAKEQKKFFYLGAVIGAGLWLTLGLTCVASWYGLKRIVN